MDVANPSFFLSNLNWPKTKVVRPSSISCKTNISDLCDSRSIIGFDIDDNFENSTTSQLFILFITDTKEEILAKKTKKKTFALDIEKWAKLPNEIFNYIYITNYQRLFSLDLYNNTIYTPNKKGLIKLLPKLYCNGSSCQLPDFDYYHCTSFINSTTFKYKEVDWE